MSEVIDLIRKCILALMQVDESDALAQMKILRNCLDVLAQNQADWSSAPSTKAAFYALSKWNEATLSPSEVTFDDIAHVSSLLNSLPVDQIFVTDGKSEAFDSPSLAAEFLYGTVALASVSLKVGRVLRLLSNQPEVGLVFHNAFNESVFVLTGKEAFYPDALAVERAFIVLVAGLLRKGLRKFPVHEALPQPTDSMPKALLKVRCAMVAALARQAIFAGKAL